ncbi:flagellar protein FlaG [Sporosarcina siberiensis]|uniref:Flagellar protein FlaG n=1 Tax=Sporosarcina siberiensis TaxID=1365606 RepID=A0ABW4SBZ3_9BACL
MVSRMDGGGSSQQGVVQVDKITPTLEIKVAPVQAFPNNTEKKSDNEQHLPAEKAQQLIDSMNTFLETSNTQLRFKFHDKLNEYYVTIVDPQTEEVIREIPSKKLMDIHAAMREFVGLLVDRKI